MTRAENFRKVAIRSAGEPRRWQLISPRRAQHWARSYNVSERSALRWIKLARTADTRRRRIREPAELASRNERLPSS